MTLMQNLLVSLLTFAFCVAFLSDPVGMSEDIMSLFGQDIPENILSFIPQGISLN